MVDGVDENARAAIVNTYKQGYADGYAAALEQLRLPTVEDGTTASTQQPSTEQSIRCLEISVQIYNLLIRKEIQKIGDIYNFHNNTGLGAIRMFGQRRFDELNEALVNAGHPPLGRFQ